MPSSYAKQLCQAVMPSSYAKQLCQAVMPSSYANFSSNLSNDATYLMNFPNFA
jgi:hypothetical protein